MQLNWLRQTGADSVIVLFAGWALGPAPYAHLIGSYDVLMVDDYRDLSTPLPDLSAYQTRILVAYSFGVAAYAHWQARNPDPFDRKVAVNGSLTPVDRATGIPPIAMDKTIDTLSDSAFQIFTARAYGKRQPAQQIDVEARREELTTIKARGPAPDTRFDRIWIASGDKIFPPANLTRAWQGQADEIKHIDAPHVPFPLWTSWQDLLQ